MIHGRFGFGTMRLPEKDGAIDIPQVCDMFDRFLAAGLNYFDTAHGYHDGLSEPALKAALTSRYPRESYVLTTKLSTDFFHTGEEIRPLFQKQLEDLGVEYVDYYFHHAQNAYLFGKYTRTGAYDEVLRLRDEGRIRHIGISFHDSPEVLEQILSARPEIEVVQIQMNYLDWNSPVVRSREVYEVCRAHGKPVFVMEPCRGGDLVGLPKEERAVIEAAGLTPQEAALRFCAGQEGVRMVLSGMSTLAQTEDNLSFMTDPQPLTKEQTAACAEAARMLASRGAIGCTRCRYCAAGCPKGIDIPDIFSCLNMKRVFGGWNAGFYYSTVYTAKGRRASDCLGCGKCEASCPQHLPIRSLLKEAVVEFEEEERGTESLREQNRRTAEGR